MGDVDVVANRWRLVEVGRVVVFASPNQYAGRIAVITEIIDHKRVVVEGPSSNASKVVPRHSARLAEVQLTPIVISKLPRGIGSGPLKGKWEAAEVEKKWEESAFAKSRAKSAKRRQLNDFERFKVMRLRKQVRFEEKKQLAKIKASA
ncbi:uncharacterized protein PV09_00260 [Verruconis gallopava]|uniref:Large ribosomal subunit protein eL14 domain-containing protein n=1 Tax=Verruconis gallopava TaxID=253628 RepID=A0A0D1Z8M5_9PEZI|nr:uncharacterized protein PV09_00260 [Verruconis gallopava]KIW09362.1 hypothetical protein PV09_00260 [Verruconis gallopava]